MMTFFHFWFFLFQMAFFQVICSIMVSFLRKFFFVMLNFVSILQLSVGCCLFVLSIVCQLKTISTSVLFHPDKATVKIVLVCTCGDPVVLKSVLVCIVLFKTNFNRKLMFFGFKIQKSRVAFLKLLLDRKYWRDYSDNQQKFNFVKFEKF